MSEKIVDARKTMRDAFEADPGWKQGYVANIACVLMDEVPGLKRGQKAIDLRNSVAEKILHRIFY